MYIDESEQKTEFRFVIEHLSPDVAGGAVESISLAELSKTIEQKITDYLARTGRTYISFKMTICDAAYIVEDAIYRIDVTDPKEKSPRNYWIESGS
jgi:hypothetical protein